jgi:hypothetical protein
VEKTGATIVNISWNLLTDSDEHEGDIRRENLCECPVCAAVAGFVERTGADVFVSEGNYKGTPIWQWSCPAGSRLIVPVLGFVDRQAALRYQHRIGERRTGAGRNWAAESKIVMVVVAPRQKDRRDELFDAASGRHVGRDQIGVS